MSSLKEKLKSNQLTIGSWITIGHPSIVEVMASAGFEWLVIDMEHTTLDFTMTQILIATIQAQDIKALVRVSKNDEVAIKRVLDAGADGIIVPMVNTKQDAIQAVEFAKYPPEGKRGVGLYRAQKYGKGFSDYKSWVNDELVIIAQIEHIDAVQNIEEIISSPGIDGIIIGPYDLSGSMGHPGDYHRVDVRDAIDTVVKACNQKRFPSGFHVIETDTAKIFEKIDIGCTFLAYSIDFFFLGDSARKGMIDIKEYHGSNISNEN